MAEILKDARAQFNAELSREREAPMRLVSNGEAMPELDDDPAYRRPTQTPAAARSIDPVVRHASATPVAGAPQNDVVARRKRVQAAAAARAKAAQAKPRTPVHQETRRCFSCGGTMNATRYRRSLMRFIRVYRCHHCRRMFEQDTRGFQGFYFGLVATLGAPFVYGCFAKPDVSYIEVGMVGMVLFLLFWPLYVNLGHYLKAPVLARNTLSPLLPISTGRTVWGRTLGGESRLYGMAFGIAFGAMTYLSLMIAIVALART